jgi:hypothetical protein
MNPQAFPMLRQGTNLGFHTVTNPGTVMQNHARKSRRGQRYQLQQKSDGDCIFTGTKLLVFDALPRKEKFNQDHLLAAIASELSKENSNSKRRGKKKELIVHMDNSKCHNGRRPKSILPEKRTRTIYFIPNICHCVTFGSSVLPKSN